MISTKSYPPGPEAEPDPAAACVFNLRVTF